jgi:hypothetical protein
MAEPDTARNDRLPLVIVLVMAGLAVALAMTVRALLSIGPAFEVDGHPAVPAAHAEGAVGATTGGADKARSDAVGDVDVSDAADPRALVGRQVEIDVVAAAVANDVAFWEGNLLVVVGPDVRARMAKPSSGTIRLKGVIEPLPPREAMLSWALTASDLARLTRDGVYLRAIDVAASQPVF